MPKTVAVVVKPNLPRFAPDKPLPPYSFVPGMWPHPVREPSGHMHRREHAPNKMSLPADPEARAVQISKSTDWLYALDLFNHGFYWEAHEQWEEFWNALGRTSPDALFTQGLIHVAAACVKAREGRAEGVSRHIRRANELLAARLEPAGIAGDAGAVLGISVASIRAVRAEIAAYQPKPEHQAKQPALRVIGACFVLA